MWISLLTLIIFKQLLWSTLIPLWQFPDEQAHFAQVQNVVESPARRINPFASTSREIYESEKILGTIRDGAGNNSFTYHPEFNIAYSESTVGSHEQTILQFPFSYRTDRVIIEATGYPPLYYVLSAFFYRLVYYGNLFDRVIVTRLFNLFLFSYTLYAVFAIAKLLFPKDRQAQFTLVLFVGFQPMFSFVSGGINSDNLYNALCTVSIYLVLKILYKGLNVSTVLLVILNVLLLEWTKPQSKLIYLLYAYPFVYSLFRLPKKNRGRILFFVVMCVIGLSAFVIYKAQNQQFISDLPAISQLSNLSLRGFLVYLKSTIIDAYRKYLPWYWGIFRWLSLTFPRPVHRIINWMTLISLIGLFRFFITLFQQREKGVPARVIIFLIYAVGSYFLGLVVFDYLFNQFHGYSFGLQGRYFFPLICVHMGLILIGIKNLINNEKITRTIMTSVGVAIVILHHGVLYFVTSSYFGNQISNFFVRASQYKSDLIKSPGLELLTLVTIISTMLFLWYYFRMKTEPHETH